MTVPAFTVVLTDQVFPDVHLERSMLAEIDAELVIPIGDHAMVIAAAAEADAVLTTYLPIDAGDIARLLRPKIIARYGIGVDNIDVAAARAAGIVVTNVPDYSVEEVAIHTLALMLAAVRRLPKAMEAARSGRWSLDGLRPIGRFSETTVGIVGLGRIGRRVAALLEPFGARLVGYDPYATGAPDGIERLQSLHDVLTVADIVTLHLPVTDATRGMIGAAELARMRRGAFLVNTSRGALVQTAALVDAIRDGGLGGAALDVLEQEAADAPAFAGLANVILTPHMAYYSESALRESQRKATTQIIKVLRGETPDYPVP
jgi:D-3-phosphoglycerate dehydrogenase